MSPQPGFSDNPFRTRADFLRAGVSLVQPLEAYRSTGKARIKIPVANGTHFSEHSAQLEGFARPLWLLANLFDEFKTSPQSSGLDLNAWITGLKNGVDPASPEYWGDLMGFDQRMVEMESIAYTLLLSPKTFAFEDDPSARANLIAWLRQINGKMMPVNNWRWFRVFTNLALNRTLGVPLHEVEQDIRDDFEVLDSFYMGDGWNSDGPWSDDTRHADYYSGSFAIQFAQLLFVRLAPDFDPERAERYKEQAKLFSAGFWRYFSAEERRAQKNCVLTTVDPNIYMSEDYNSPQSVYWCLKPFIAVGLPEGHEFWACEEEPYPLEIAPDLGQTSAADHKAIEAKYGKLAYSSAFGLSVSVAGPHLKNLASDNTLAVSWDGGKAWKVVFDPTDTQIESVKLGSETVPTLASTYKPFGHLDIEIRTKLIPPVRKFPGWHLRVHKIRYAPSVLRSDLSQQLRFADSGFSVSGVSSKGVHISERPCKQGNDILTAELATGAESWWAAADCALIRSESGASGVMDLSEPVTSKAIHTNTEGSVIKPHANTNIMIQRSLMPSMLHRTDLENTSDLRSADPLVQTIVTGIFAVQKDACSSAGGLLQMWQSLSRENLTELDI